MTESDSDEVKALFRASLAGHSPTGYTRHLIPEGELNLNVFPSELRIVRYANDPSVYLFYCDHDGVEFTDTYHESVEQAMRQAEFEYNVTEQDWVAEDSGQEWKAQDKA